MKLSVIVPTYNGAKKLPTILTALEGQAHPADEVIVVVDGSTDNTLEMLNGRKWKLPLKVVEQKNSGRSVTRNKGVTNATGDLLLFFDDDMRPLPDCTAKHMQHHTQYPGSILTGGTNEEVLADSSEIFRFKSFLSSRWLEPLRNAGSVPLKKESVFVTTQNFSISKADFLRTGGFDERLTDAEDYELAVRAFKMGIPLYFNYNAFAWHDDPITAHSYIRRQRQYAAAQQKLMDIHPDWVSEGFLKKPYVPGGAKASLFKVFCGKGWIKAIDNNSLKWLPQSLRYKLYDFIITANGNFFPDKVKL